VQPGICSTPSTIVPYTSMTSSCACEHGVQKAAAPEFIHVLRNSFPGSSGLLGKQLMRDGCKVDRAVPRPHRSVRKIRPGIAIGIRPSYLRRSLAANSEINRAPRQGLYECHAELRPKRNGRFGRKPQAPKTFGL